MLNPETHESRKLRLLRPKTRGECVGGERPCPWVSCAMHLYIDVLSSGSLKLNFPDLEVSEMKESCVLDVADRNEITLEEVGEFMNITRERVRQIEVCAMRKVRNARSDLQDHILDGGISLVPMSENVRSKTERVKDALAKTHGNYRKIAELTGLDPGNVNAILSALLHQKEVKRDVRESPYVYWLASKPTPQGLHAEDDDGSGRPDSPDPVKEAAISEEDTVIILPVGCAPEEPPSGRPEPDPPSRPKTFTNPIRDTHSVEKFAKPDTTFVYDVVISTLELKAQHHEEEAMKIRSAIDVLRKTLL